MSQEAELPHYPALARCLLIDARHGSRTELSKDLRASLLFSQVFEAQSLNGAMSTLEYEEMDGCFLGPSVTPEKAAHFLKQAKTRVLSKDIAFISVMNRDDHTEEKETAIRDAGVHGVILRPCTKMKLFDWVVRAVVAANGSGAWASIFKQSGHDQIDIPDALARKPAVKPLPPEEKPVEHAMFNALSKAVSTELKEVIVGIESGELRLDPSGNPTPRAKEVLAKLVASVIDKIEPKDNETAQFTGHFEMALIQWFIDMIRTDEKEATQKLRERLLEYTPTPEE